MIASKLGAMAEIIKDNQTGMFFESGNPADLARVMRTAWRNPEDMARMGKLARTEFLSKYTAQANYEKLMRIYMDLLPQAVVDRVQPVVLA